MKTFIRIRDIRGQQKNQTKRTLTEGSKIGVIGGGPAGSFFSYFILDMARRLDLDISVDIYEPKDFSRPGACGCNKCGGIISESLVQLLATEGFILPSTIVQRGIDSYVMHTDVGNIRIDTPLHEKRIGAVHRGCGPKSIKNTRWDSFDGYLLAEAKEKGANVIPEKVEDITWENGIPRIRTSESTNIFRVYDLIAIATGINTSSLKLSENFKIGYTLPKTTKTFICEYYLGEETVAEYLGSSMHVFMLNIPRLEFAAIIPKGAYVTLCMLGQDIDRDLVNEFINTIEVKQCFPPNFQLDKGKCQCWPSINTGSAVQPFSERVVYIGDCGVTRLYKDGIGAAYMTAKAAASTAILQGISATDFQKYFWPTCRTISIDNFVGKGIFTFTRLVQKLRFVRKGILRMVATEQHKKGRNRIMSTVLWDMFTGSSPYRDIFLRTLRPSFWGRFIINSFYSLATLGKN